MELQPEEGGGPGAADLENAHQDQEAAADPGDELGVPPGEWNAVIPRWKARATMMNGMPRPRP